MELLIHIIVGACIGIPPILDCWWHGIPLAEVYNIETLKGLFRWKI